MLLKEQPIREFDHLMCGVQDVEAIEKTFEGLGFVVGPVTPLHGAGVANRRILLTPKLKEIANYIEFMQLGGASGDIPSYLTKWLKGSLEGDEGINSFIMRSDDARATYAHFQKLHQHDPAGGFDPVILELDFQQAGPNGEVYDVGFSNAIFPDLEPPLYVSTSQIRTLDFYMNTYWRTHPNGALTWTATIAVSDTPLETARDLQAVWDGKVEPVDENIVLCGPGEMPLMIFTPAAFQETYGVAPKKQSNGGDKCCYSAGLHISVADLTQTKEFLQQRGVDTIEKNEHVIISPEQAHGLLICFEQDEEQ